MIQFLHECYGCHLMENTMMNTNIYNIQKCTFPDPAPEGRTETLPVTYIPQILAANIQYKYI